MGAYPEVENTVLLSLAEASFAEEAERRSGRSVITLEHYLRREAARALNITLAIPSIEGSEACFAIFVNKQLRFGEIIDTHVSTFATTWILCAEISDTASPWQANDRFLLFRGEYRGGKRFVLDPKGLIMSDRPTRCLEEFFD